MTNSITKEVSVRNVLGSTVAFMGTTRSGLLNSDEQMEHTSCERCVCFFFRYRWVSICASVFFLWGDILSGGYRMVRGQFSKESIVWLWLIYYACGRVGYLSNLSRCHLTIHFGYSTLLSISVLDSKHLMHISARSFIPIIGFFTLMPGRSAPSSLTINSFFK